MLCENCIHKDVCRYKTEFENLKNDIDKVTPTWAPDRYAITIECKNFRKEGIVQRPVDYNQFVGGDRSRKPVEKEET